MTLVQTLGATAVFLPSKSWPLPLAPLVCHPQTTYKALRRAIGWIPHTRVGTHIKFYPTTVADWLERQQIG